MATQLRTHTCGALRAENAGSQVTLNGWVHRIRNHGGVRFFNIRDRYGITQVVLDDDASAELVAVFEDLKMEYCVSVSGVVRPRPSGMENTAMDTGAIEISAQELSVFSASEILPFVIDDENQSVKEDTRLKYRYLDLRNSDMRQRIQLRHKVMQLTRSYLSDQGFLEIETPTMIRSTPEGARDFLVPSRIHKGQFYALPQSPQLFKQILMVSGFDKYFQLAHCFRDEDARGDRQPEHTQIDMEMSFVSAEDVYALVEGLMGHIFKGALDIELPKAFVRISYDEAMNRFGTDKPDLRFGLEMEDGAPWAASCGFKVFADTIANGGVVRVLRVPGGSTLSRKEISALEDQAKVYGAKGLAWTKVSPESQLEGGIGKFITDIQQQIIEHHGTQPGDALLFMADQWKTACTSLGAVRSKLGKDLGLIDPDQFAFAWIVDFPMFEFNEEDQRWEPAHHMFTMPQAQYLDTMEQDPGAVKGDLYDLVCNGYEMASGSIRIHDPQLQQRVFDLVGFPREEAEERFGFLLEAFKYGAPPHGGIAPGLDRLLMVMTKQNSIREVMAFPKNTAGISPMDDSPTQVDNEQLKELGLALLPSESE